MKLLFRSRLAWLLTLALLPGCKGLRELQTPPLRPLPSDYVAASDSSSVADLAWPDFFADPQLRALIDTALRHNLDIRLAQQRIQIGQTGYQVRQRALLPTVSAVATTSVDRFGEYTMNGVGNYDTNLSDFVQGDRRIPTPTTEQFVGLRSAWEVDVWGKLRNQRQAASLRLLSSELGRQWVVTSMVAEIAARYYELLALDSELDIIRRNVALQEQVAELMDIQKQGGRATELAVQQATAQMLQTKALAGEVQQRRVATENQLNVLLGRFPSTVPRGRPLPEQELPARVSAGVPSALLRRRPDIREAELNLQATKADLRAARALFYPSLRLNAHTGYQAFTPGLLLDPMSFAYGLLAGVAMPLFDQNNLRANYRRSEAETLTAFYQYQQAILTGFSEVITAMRGMENYQQTYAYKAEEVATLQRAIATANDLYVAGYASYLEVITAQERALNAERQLNEFRREQFFYLIQLYRALGGGWQP